MVLKYPVKNPPAATDDPTKEWPGLTLCEAASLVPRTSSDSVDSDILVMMS